MSQSYYKIYIDNVFDLAETLVVKSEESADAVNGLVKLLHGVESVDPYDKSSWKYYQNICGIYHNTDEMIYITSLDTLENIAFTKENLAVHILTAQAYQYNNRHYRELVSNYAIKEQLILGVLYPADMDKAINAEDGEILSYPSYLVEDNETSLIPQLNNWIKAFKTRWHNTQFGLTDSLYVAANLGVMYHNLIPTILNLRLKACKTNEAHSFHVRQYLASHGMLDVYLEFMTKKQALFFYRNIAYIERNNGKREIFHWLVDRIMTERRLPVAEFTMKHNETGMLENLYPEITFKKKPLNTSFNAQEKNSFSLDEVLGKEMPLALGNPDYRLQNQRNIQTKFDHSLSSVVATKMLESAVVDYTDATPYTQQGISLNYWIYLSSINLYPVYIGFKDPRSGERYSLKSSDAFIYWMYVLSKALGSNLTTVPKFYANRVQQFPKVSVDELMEVADKQYVKPKVAQELLDDMPELRPSFSTKAFFDLTQEVFHAAQRQLRYISNQEHLYTRGLVDNMVNRIYSDNVIHLEGEGELYSDWLNNLHLPTTDFDQQEYLALYKEIFESATGSTLNTTLSMRNLQKAMVGLLEKLSSYSVQFITDINSSNIIVLNWAVIRLGDIDYKSKAAFFIPDVGVRVQLLRAKQRRRIKLNANCPMLRLRKKAKSKHRYQVEMPLDMSAPSTGTTNELRRLQVGPLQVTAFVASDTPEAYKQSVFIGYQGFLDIPDSEKGKLKDHYCECFEEYTGPKMDINELILFDEIDSFIFSGIYSDTIHGFEYSNYNGVTNAFVNNTFIRSLNGFYAFNGNDSVASFNLSNGTMNVNGFTYSASINDLTSFIMSSTSPVLSGIHYTTPIDVIDSFETGSTSPVLDGIDYVTGSEDIGSLRNAGYVSNPDLYGYNKPNHQMTNIQGNAVLPLVEVNGVKVISLASLFV